MSEKLTFTVATLRGLYSCKDIPADVKERAKQVIFDEIACATSAGAASPATSARATPRSRRPRGGAHLRYGPTRLGAECGARQRRGRPWRGGRRRARLGGHPGASIVHAAVAMAERQRATGAELLNAVVLGYDVGIRVVEACGRPVLAKNGLA